MTYGEHEPFAGCEGWEFLVLTGLPWLLCVIGQKLAVLGGWILFMISACLGFEVLFPLTARKILVIFLDMYRQTFSSNYL